MQVKNGSSKPSRLSTNLAEINVTPLVDVMLVLLIIFMVTAPMMEQSGIQVNLPSAETQNEPSTGGLILSITKDHNIYLENQSINLFLLEGRIKNHSFGDKKKVVFIKADKAVDYGYVIDVMDILKKAGVETVGMIVDKKEQK